MRWLMHVVFLAAYAAPAAAQVRTGNAAYGDWRTDAPGVARLIRPADLPAPYATASASSGANTVDRPAGVLPRVPPGFRVAPWTGKLARPRTIRVAPDGTVFIAEAGAGRVCAYRPAADGARPEAEAVFAGGLDLPYGIAFWPPGPAPRAVYVGESGQVLRYPWHPGALRPDGPPRVIIAGLPEGGGHWTRDVAVSPDGTRLYVAVGSASDAAPDMSPLGAAARAALEARDGAGAAWGDEADRADVLAFDPEGGGKRHVANGLRNCSAMAVRPDGALWCAVNERDGLGDDLPPDYVTQVRPGGFYGWPWFYIGGHADPRHKGERPDLAGRVIMPDVLIQPHSAPLGLAFYDAGAFPPAYRDDAFVTLHGSWNRAHRTGYKLVRLRFRNGEPTGVYEDFMTGFVTEAGAVWGRPTGVAVMRDGALLVSEDVNGMVWRVRWGG